MRSLSSPAKRQCFAGTGIALGVLAPLGMLAISAMMLFDLRADAWVKAAQTSRNLSEVIENDIVRNIETIDLSLRGARDNLSAPGLPGISPELRQLVLFDRAATARDMGVMLVTDESGTVVFDAKSVPPRPLNNADRAYFQVHRDRSDAGLYISEPLVSRHLGVPVIVLSRRIDKPDGSFGGIVQASLRLSYFSRLFENLSLGSRGAINLYRTDGTRVVRHPDLGGAVRGTVAHSPVFQRFLREGSGSFAGPSVHGDEMRHHTFTRLGELALVLDVSLGAVEIEAEWRAKAMVIGGIVAVLCGVTAGLSLLFGRELRRRTRMQAELARLSVTDALTGLPNRRRFEEALAGIAEPGVPVDEPVSLLVVDVDHFKAVNDRHGHAVGDAVLRGLAQCLLASVHRPGDLVCRVGGEEFVLLLPATDLANADRVADRIHAGVARFGLPAAGIAPGAFTVSIGLATTGPGEGGPRTLTDLYRLADAALYTAKASGRNRTCVGRPHREAVVAEPPALPYHAVLS